jgi:cyclic beta-1,2-glucan synthetase
MDLVSSVWAVFCGAVHAEEAFDTALAELYDAKNGVLKLLAPPFTDEGGRSAGYIESYIEGVRENGGQYAHAAAWAVIAACMLGRAGAARELFAAIDPIAHGAKPEKYAVEPYAAAGDTGGCGELTGRGGWTWYTGAAGWLYTAAVRHILGIKKTGRLLKVEPVTELDSFEVSLRFGKTVYRIEASRGAARSCHADGAETDAVLLSDDGREHRIAVTYV